MRPTGSFSRRVVSQTSAFGFVFLLAVGSLPGAKKTNQMVRPATATPSQRLQIAEAYGKLPLRFEPNLGLADSGAKFLARGPGYTMLLSDSRADVVLSGSRGTSKITLRFDGAAVATKVTGSDLLPGISNYFFGNDPSKWRTNVPGYGKVTYRGIYPGVDLVYYGNQQRLEYDFVVSPGADPNAIRLSFEGVDSVKTAENGDLLLETQAGVLRQQKPRVYQMVNGKQVERVASYRLRKDQQVAFAIDAYDRNAPLVIDPVLTYSTFLGAVGVDSAFAIAVDSLGSAYIAGSTTSSAFPLSSAGQGASGGAVDAFVTKLSPSGNALAYSTYLGGQSDDVATAIAVDSNGNAYVTGNTLSANFPTSSPITGAAGTALDAFVTKISPSGNTLTFSTLLGGSGDDRGTGIAIDTSLNIYICGVTSSTNLPAVSAFRGSYIGGSRDAFVAKIISSGASIGYLTYLGGSADDAATAIAVDAGTGEAFVAGYTSSIDFTTQSPLRASNTGGIDAFVTKLAANGSSLVYSTYLGGAGDDRATGVALDSAKSAYVGGWTFSSNFPTASPINASRSGPYDGFVSKLNLDGSALTYSTYLGGSGEDFISSIAVDANNQAVVAGSTSSPNFPTIGTSQAFYNGRPQGAFVTRIAASGASLVSSTYLGGSPDDVANGVAVDTAGAIYAAGSTQGADFPTASPFQATLAGGTDAFVVKLGDGTPITTTITTNPVGLTLVVDGISGPSPRFFGFVPSSTHAVNAPSPQVSVNGQSAGGARYNFTSWSNGGGQSQNITAPAADATFTANFSTQYLLSSTVVPVGGGAITTTPSSTDNYFTSGTAVQVGVNTNPGYVFAGFSGDLSGTLSPQTLPMSSPRSVTALFNCTYLLDSGGTSVDGIGGSGAVGLTTGSTCSAGVSSTVDWIIITSGASGNGSRSIGYTVAANLTASARSGSIVVAGSGTSQTFTIAQGAQPPASITFTSTPSGRQITVDGANYTTPVNIQFAPGSSHVINVPSPQTTTDTKFTFASWSDGGGQSHSVLAPAVGASTLNATFTSAFKLTTSVVPNGSGTITAIPASGDGFYAPGTAVQLTATPANGATFSGWSGALSGTANPQLVTMSAARTVSASFSPKTCGSDYSLSPQTISSEAAGGTFTVNITTGEGCFWSATLAASFVNPFVTLPAVTTGASNGSLQFTVAANATAFPRTGSINIQGQLVQVVQKGVAVVQDFNDVPPTHVFFDFIELMKRYSISNGCTATTFCPDQVTTRAKMAEFVIKGKIGENFVFNQTPFFTDVPTTHAQFKYIQKMKELGITVGCTETTYCPDNPVTRGEMSVFLIRGKLNVQAPAEFTFNSTPYFQDVPGSHVFFPFVQKMKDLGITAGCTATTYCPADPNTLGQISVFVIRAFSTP